VTGGVLAVSPIIAHALTRAPPEARVAHAYAALVDALVAWIVDGARRAGRARVALAGGCLASRVLTPALEARLAASGLDVVSPASFPSGDGGLALGQAWIAARVPPGATFVHDARRARYTSPGGTSPCV
jgi:hydrogenase maturation protein HypF